MRYRNTAIITGCALAASALCLLPGCRSASSASTPSAGTRAVVNQMVMEQQKEQEAIENNPNIPPDVKAKMFAYSNRGYQPGTSATH